MAKKKFTLKLGPFSFVFWPEISTSLRDPLGCSDLSQIFFGSSLIATEWDKIVAEIIHKTFVFLRHPNDMTCPDLTYPDITSPDLPEYHSDIP